MSASENVDRANLAVPAIHSQRQDSLLDQLETVVVAAERMGCYDAADWLRKQARLEAISRGMFGGAS